MTGSQQPARAVVDQFVAAWDGEVTLAPRRATVPVDVTEIHDRSSVRGGNGRTHTLEVVRNPEIVGVQEGDPVAGRLCHASVPCRCRARVLLPDVRDAVA